MSTLPRCRHARVIHNMILTDTREGQRPSRQERSDLTIGMVGRLTAWKGQDVFLEAFAQAFRGTDVRARIVGSALFGEDVYAATLVERARALGISSQVEFRGFREDIWAELDDLDILVHCSVRPEPFGQVVLEGLAAGVPVVAANAGGPKELITNGVDGMLTTPGDSGDLADVLRTLAFDRALRSRIAAAGRRRSGDFAPERMVEQVLAFYAPLLPRR
jgi:glycosyltransferase involved in cell wall biosynthesis